MNKIFRFVVLAIMTMAGLSVSAQSAEYQKKAGELMSTSYGDQMTKLMGGLLKQGGIEIPVLDEFISGDEFKGAITQCIAVVAEKNISAKEMNHIIKLYSNPKAKPVVEKSVVMATEVMPEIMQKLDDIDEESLPEIKKAQCSKEYREYFTKNMESSFSVTTTTETTDDNGNVTTETSPEVTSEDKNMAAFMQEYLTELLLDYSSKNFTLDELKLLNKITSDPAVKKLQNAVETIENDPQCKSIMEQRLGKILQQLQ